MTGKILLIDDEPDFTELTGTLLGFHDFDVDTINDPTLAETKLAAGKYTVIVTDLMMPTLDGFALIKKARAMDKYNATPIIVLSAKILTDDERKFLLQNNVSVMTKPFEPRELVDRIVQAVTSADT